MILLRLCMPIILMYKKEDLTTSHQSEWLKLTSQETTDVGEDAEKEEPSYTVGRGMKVGLATL